MTDSQDSVCAIILAAGESKRYGPENKLLVELDEVAVLERVVRCVAQSGAGKIIVVTGADHQAIETLLSGYDVECIHNSDWETGMGSSLAKGAQSIDEQQFSGVMVCLGDLPFLSERTIRQVLERFRSLELKSIVIPICNKRRGHPVVFPISYLRCLSELKGDEGAKSVIQTAMSNIDFVSVESEGIFRDVDMPGDIDSKVG